jgi:uncharacterized protein CbrC (UPF0167 family)
MTALPVFTYHPDPIGTGSVRPAEIPCSVCGEQRGYVYPGPVYSVHDARDICPWCIASGRAASEFDAMFTDIGDGVPAGVPAEVTAEIARRTPGFMGWQQEHWMFHCNDGCAFRGRVGWDDLQALPDALASIRAEGHQEEMLEYLHPDGDATAYLFQCRHCDAHVAYADYS